jgi:hypothetical protein
MTATRHQEDKMAYDTNGTVTSGPAAPEPKLVECWITATSPHDGLPLGITEDEAARDAVTTVPGLADGRTREIEQISQDEWLIEMTDVEIAVLESQGYLDLEKGPYRIQAEMP